ncbi:hypothetical protein MPSEU_000225300 [Mayamaea pseudoterrestris]|nr:hypothetical protein MPSEU_000225300 [Mayamaea pseudoterrestris]
MVSWWTAVSLLLSSNGAAAFIVNPLHNIIASRRMSTSSIGASVTCRSMTAQDDSSSSSSSYQPGISSVDLRGDSKNSDPQTPDSPSPRFLQGDDLQALRAKVLELSQELQSLRLQQQQSNSRRKTRRRQAFHSDEISSSSSSSSSTTLDSRIQQLERSILQAQQVDAEYVYATAKQRSHLAQRQRQYTLALHYQAQAMEAREALPQFQLQGLWVGKFGGSGGKFELINVTYTDDDMLVAHKVTGRTTSMQQQQLPIFSVPLGASDETMGLAPIQLQADAMADAALWGGQTFLPRFVGKGRVEEPVPRTTIDNDGTIFLAPRPSDVESSNSNKLPLWVDGQLILVSPQYFCFYWLGTSEQVFFGRPSPELTLKLIKTQTQQTDPIREHLSRCWRETEHVEDDLEVEGYNMVAAAGAADRCGDYYGTEGCFE